MKLRTLRVVDPPTEDLDRLLNLIGAADHRIELPLAGELDQIAAELVEAWCPRW